MCHTSIPLESATDISGLVNVVTTTFSSANTQNGCNAWCTNNGGYTYSIFQPGLSGLLASCYCTDRSPQADYVVKGRDSAGNCDAGSYRLSYLKSNQYTFNTCATGSTLSGGPAAFATKDDASCFVRCAGYKYLSMTAQPNGDYVCVCGTILSQGPLAVCDKVPVQQLYNNVPVVSAVARRNARPAAGKRSLCPEPLTACKIPGLDAFECIDTSVEVESCGACVSGHMDASLDVKLGTGENCLAIEGVAMGGVSCQAGECVVSACKKNFVLEDGVCFPA